VKPSERYKRDGFEASAATAEILMFIDELASDARSFSGMLDALAADVEALKQRHVQQCPRCATSMEVDPTAKPAPVGWKVTDDNGGWYLTYTRPSEPEMQRLYAEPVYTMAMIKSGRQAPMRPGPQEQPRLEAWALTTLDGDTQGVWFERESAEPDPAEEVLHKMVAIYDGEQIAPAGSVVLTAEQAERVRTAIRRAITHNAGTGLASDDLAALGIEVDR
jgi:hypothetical protein